jgi:hypothetical protein
MIDKIYNSATTTSLIQQTTNEEKFQEKSQVKIDILTTTQTTQLKSVPDLLTNLCKTTTVPKMLPFDEDFQLLMYLFFVAMVLHGYLDQLQDMPAYLP